MSLKERINRLAEIWLQANDEEKNTFCNTICATGRTGLNILVAFNNLEQAVTARKGGSK